MVLARPRTLRTLLPRDTHGAVDLAAVQGVLDALAEGRRTPPRRAREPVLTLLDALAAMEREYAPPAVAPEAVPEVALAAPPPRRVETRPPPAALTPIEPLPDPPSVVLRFDEEPFELPMSEEATQPPAIEVFAEPAPVEAEASPLTLESLPPPPPFEDSLVPAMPLPVVRAVDLIEPSLPPPRAVPVADFADDSVRLSLAPLEPLPAPEPVALTPAPPPVQPLPRTEAPSGTHLQLLRDERSSQRASSPPEALELDLSELGGSDVPPVMPRIPPQPAPSSLWAEAIEDEDIEPIDDLEVMELEDVRVARETSRPTPVPAPPPPRKPPTPPPGLRKIR